MKLDDLIWGVQDSALRAYKITRRLEELDSLIYGEVTSHLERALARAKDSIGKNPDRNPDTYADDRRGMTVSHGERGMVHQGSMHGCGICEKDRLREEAP